MKQKEKIELLAPAGSYEIFQAVIAAGADAVYVGGNAFGARAYANNFSEEELLRAIDYAHMHHRKLYLTVNTLLKEQELYDQLYDYLLPYYRQGLDAVIVQDMGAFRFIKENFPDLEIHTSTQMTVTNRYGALMMKDLGAKRVVTAREMSFAEIEDIVQNVDIEIESFVHGALCYCFSGQCLLSSIIGGRSGNRGRCAQPCRLPYEAYNEKMQRISNSKQPYLLSPKDLCTIEMIPQLVKAGVYSFKIEGRMKQAEYAAGVVSIYRKYIDLYLENGEENFRVSKADMKKLLDLGNRSGFTEGYYKKHNGPDMITFEQPSHKKGDEALQEAIRNQYLNVQLKEKINGTLILSKDLPAIMTVSYEDYYVVLEGEVVQAAQKQPLSYEKVEENMKKTGNTPFEFEEFHIQMDDDIFMPVKALNQLRRDALEQLEAQVLSAFRRTEMLVKMDKQEDLFPNKKMEEPVYTASIESRDQLRPLLMNEMISAIYLDSSCYKRSELPDLLKQDCELITRAHQKVYFILPAVFRKHTSDFYQSIVSELSNMPLDGFVVKSYDAMQFVKQYFPYMQMIADHNLYSYNTKALEALSQFAPTRVTAPLELNKKELTKRNNEKSEFVVYGRLPLMTSAQCVVCNTSGCKKQTGITYLKDRYDVEFPVRNHCEECYNVIYNSLPQVLIGQAEELKKMKFAAYRFAFTTEDKKEIERILQLGEAYFLNGKNGNIKEMLGDAFTYGHYKRGVE